jgi:two-component system NarL family sensor kinase
MNELTAQAGRYFPNTSPDSGWMRLILPLKVGDSLIGFWLLGRRDPDDIYPQAELPILQALANQTAIALSNILQTKRVQKLYEDDIKRNEKNRLRLALDLHDSVLNQLAILRLSVDDTHVSPNFQGAYDEVTRRLREIVTDLRPPMLSYGLKLAIEELADNLMERSKDTVNVVTDLQTGDEIRYAENIEQHLYRITQEACENAIRHAHAANIRISGALNPQNALLKIEDDGTGFDTQLELTSLIANNHFGLAGMVERAHLIGAEINIQSSPNTGTLIQITWDNTPKEN